MHKAWHSKEEVPYCFSRSSIKFWGHTRQKNHQFWPELSFSGLQLQFEFTDGFEMMHNVWHSTYWFFWSSIEFQGHTGRKIDNLNPVRVRLLGRSLLSNPSDLPHSLAIIWELRSWTYTSCLCWGWQFTVVMYSIRSVNAGDLNVNLISAISDWKSSLG